MRDTEVLIELLRAKTLQLPGARPRRGRPAHRPPRHARWEDQRIELLGAMRSRALLRAPRSTRRCRDREHPVHRARRTTRGRRAPAAGRRTLEAPPQRGRRARAPTRPTRRSTTSGSAPSAAGTRPRRSSPVVGRPAAPVRAADRGHPGRARRSPRRDRAPKGGSAMPPPARRRARRSPPASSPGSSASTRPRPAPRGPTPGPRPAGSSCGAGGSAPRAPTRQPRSCTRPVASCAVAPAMRRDR